LITFLLCHDKVLRQPLLYLSLYFKQNRERYYQLLESTRREGDWEEWVSFFLEGVAQTGDGAVATARRLVTLVEGDRERIQMEGRRAGSALRVHGALAARPVIDLQEASRRSGLSFPTTATAMSLLAELGIAREVTGKKRNRAFAYDGYLAILNEGTEATGAR
jgi:Fic family protein